jgi:glycosyltransferase involved in cell wall biosynthesis
MPGDRDGPRQALILVENLSVPFDRRVWQEARALVDAGWDVVVVCPAGSDRDSGAYERVDGVEIHRFPLRAAARRRDYVREYVEAFVRITRIVERLASQRRFDVVQACNPPDFLLLCALRVRRRGAGLVFDQHDLVPELYESRWGNGWPLHAARLLERLSFRLADVVISTNDSYRAVALERGGFDPDDVFVVRNAPPADRFAGARPDGGLKAGSPHLIAYLGLMGPQDGVDWALQALARLRIQRSDWRAVFMGDGDVFEEMRALASRLRLTDRVEFTGRVGDDVIGRVLATADVCLSPEPPSPLNDVSTLVKVVEYMALGRPIVAFDLRETRVSAGEAAAYAQTPDAAAYASAISALLDDPERRAQMAEVARARFSTELAWERSVDALLAAYGRAASKRR